MIFLMLSYDFLDISVAFEIKIHNCYVTVI